MKHEWIDQEEKALEHELKKVSKEKRPNYSTMYHFLVFFGFIGLLSYANASTMFHCPNCEKPIECRGIWGETWVCPNANCQYENYEGINYCGICGTYRYSKQ